VREGGRDDRSVYSMEEVARDPSTSRAEASSLFLTPRPGKRSRFPTSPSVSQQPPVPSASQAFPWAPPTRSSCRTCSAILPPRSPRSKPPARSDRPRAMPCAASARARLYCARRHAGRRGAKPLGFRNVRAVPFESAGAKPELRALRNDLLDALGRYSSGSLTEPWYRVTPRGSFREGHRAAWLAWDRRGWP